MKTAKNPLENTKQINERTNKRTAKTNSQSIKVIFQFVFELKEKQAVFIAC